MVFYESWGEKEGRGQVYEMKIIYCSVKEAEASETVSYKFKGVLSFMLILLFVSKLLLEKSHNA